MDRFTKPFGVHYSRYVDQCVCWSMQRSDAVGLVVIDEEDNQTLLVHRISADDIYRRQEGLFHLILVITLYPAT